jgi:two-component system, chemotaxis family, protein-glutamate methylesterase/glutaminase
VKGRVLIVDDSAFVRKIFREILTRHGIEVIDAARDGLEALEKIAALEPDVVTLDLMMPHLDGLAVLKELAARGASPPVVVVSAAGEHTEDGISALAHGAIAVIEKPTSLATARLFEVERALLAAVEAALASRPRWSAPSPPPPPAPAIEIEDAPRTGLRTSLLAIGASTGGPQAIGEILSVLPGDLPVPVVIVVHMPVGYTEGFAQRLDTRSALHVVEASEALVLTPGMVVIARAGVHTRIMDGGDHFFLHLDADPSDALHRPSVDVLFESASRAAGDRLLAAVLTGMGDDGLAGSRAVRAAGGRILTEAESSCVVWGMPRVVYEAGLAERQVTLDRMAAALLEML